ncbi:MAG: protein-glutamate O-methyltransferase CheR [Thermoplasmata archaeon]|nr:MAG: protein-glutamate O-methyltransferase CheR [Thermoplasmata archaeon]
MTIEKTYSKDFHELKENITKILDFNSFQYNDSYLARRFKSRLNHFKIDTYHEYWGLLKEDLEEQQKLRKELTVNVTEFFRDHTTFNTLQNEVIPEVINQNNDNIRIWSAGSSDGREAYSIAMLFIEKMGEQQAKRKLKIIGTDIDKDCLEYARKGTYSGKSGYGQMDVGDQLGYFKSYKKYVDINDGSYTFKPAVREIVNFEFHDLISGRKKSNFDIIFCRNVVIYFNRELKNTLYMDFYNALKPGGKLILGKSETLLGDAMQQFKKYKPVERIYLK